MLHWDGFSTTKINQKICWAVDLVILNAEKVVPIGPISILFIPSSSDKLIKYAYCNILTCFFKPLVKYLESIFVERFPVLYVYLVESISDKLLLILTNELITLRAVVTIWTRDHPAQCKIGGLKMGGYTCCRRHRVASRWRGIPNPNNGLMEYYDNRKKYIYVFVNQNVEETAITFAN